MRAEDTSKGVDIRDIVEQALEDAQTELKPAIPGQVNWADLHCAEVTLTYNVVIEEAAPNCLQLIQYVQQRLRDAGYNDVDVQTEW